MRLYIILLSCIYMSCTSNEIKYSNKKNTNSFHVKNYTDFNLKSWTIITNNLQEESCSIKLRNKWSEGWYILCYWEGDTLNILQPYNYIENNMCKTECNFKIQSIHDTTFFNMFYSFKQDSMIALSLE